MFLNIVLVGVGGAAGSIGRYLVGIACMKWLGAGFPIGTLLVNVVGCAAIGTLGAGLALTENRDHPFRLLVIVGVLGGFTTFSAFGAETLTLWRAGKGDLAALNIALNVVLGLGAVAVGAAAWRSLASA